LDNWVENRRIPFREGLPVDDIALAIKVDKSGVIIVVVPGFDISNQLTIVGDHFERGAYFVWVRLISPFIVDALEGEVGGVHQCKAKKIRVHRGSISGAKLSIS